MAENEQSGSQPQTSEEEIEQPEEKIEPQHRDLEQKIEAALFMSSKTMSIRDLQKITGADIDSIKAAVKNLQNSYVQRGSWIEIVRVDKSFLMRLKPERTDTISSFVQETELSKRALRVLAMVAQNDGLLQSRVARVLGGVVYDAVPELVQKGYIHTEIKGHSKVLKLTQKFRNYFGEIPLTGSDKKKETEEPQQKLETDNSQTSN